MILTPPATPSLVPPVKPALPAKSLHYSSFKFTDESIIFGVYILGSEINVMACLRSLRALLALSFAVSFCSAQQRSDRVSGPTISALDGREWLISPPAEDQSQSWPHRSLVRRRQPYIAISNQSIKGSSGCGTLTGTFHGANNRISIAVKWVDDPEVKCEATDRADASQIVATLNRVSAIVAPPEYWRDDALLLSNGKGETQVVLSPMKTGSDLSDLEDTFWKLSGLGGSKLKTPDIVIWIERGQITLSTPSIFHSYPFRYELAGLKFFPAWANGGDRSKAGFAKDQRDATAFERSLHRIAGYRQEGEHLIFADKARQTLFALNRLRTNGLEARQWRIAKYRSEESTADADGLTVVTQFADIAFLHGRVIGTPGCGGWAGSYKLQGNTLLVNADFVLAGVCRRAEEEQGGTVVKVFKDKLHVESGGTQILLRGSDGRAAILLVEL